jgi:hypothetical protein
MEYKALEVNTSVIGHDGQVPTWVCTPLMGSFDLSESLYENDGTAMSSVGDMGDMGDMGAVCG